VEVGKLEFESKYRVKIKEYCPHNNYSGDGQRHRHTKNGVFCGEKNRGASDFMKIQTGRQPEI
jgi:hypothetical protein